MVISIGEGIYRVLGYPKKQFINYKSYRGKLTPINAESAGIFTKKNKDNDSSIHGIWNEYYHILTIFPDNFDRPWRDVIIERIYEVDVLPHEIVKLTRVAELVDASL